MSELIIKPASETRWDCASFGEVMLRFDPGFGRVRNARSFQVWEGGGEYNVARAMRKCWGKRAMVATAIPKNDLGWLVEDFIMQGGVDLSHVIWRDFDGLGKNTRVGLNFTEKGFGIRPALGCSDRGHSAASQIRPGEVNWEKLFGEEGVRWFEAAQRLEPGNADTLFNLGYALEQGGRPAEACTAFAQAVQAKPTLDRAWYGLATAQARQGHHAEAAQALEETVRLQPMHGEAWYHLGMACHLSAQAERLQEVIVSLKRFDPKRANQLILDCGRAEFAHLRSELPF